VVILKRTRQEILSSILRWTLEGIFIVGVVLMLFLRQFLLRYYLWLFGGETEYFNLILGVLYFSGVPALVIIRQLIGIFKTVSLKDPFVLKNVRCLKAIAICCFIITTAFIVKVTFYLTLVSTAAIIVFLIAGLAAYVVSLLFQEAVRYKVENDLTI